MCEIAANWYEWLQMDRIGSGHNGFFKYDRFMCASLRESSFRNHAAVKRFEFWIFSWQRSKVNLVQIFDTRAYFSSTFSRFLKGNALYANWLIHFPYHYSSYFHWALPLSYILFTVKRFKFKVYLDRKFEFLVETDL